MATMNPAATIGAPYRVPPEPSRVPSILMALVVHAGLLGFLWAGIRWQNTAPVSVEAEVWDMKVQQAAPQAPPEPVRPPTPQPVPKVVEPEVERPVAPKPPDIALERIKEQKHKLLEKKLAEEKLLKEKQKELADEKAKELADKKAKEKADKLAKAAAEAAEKKKLDKAREDTLKRMESQLSGTGKDAVSTAPRIDTGYINAILRKIDGNTTYNGDRDVPGNPRVEFEIKQLPTGEILSVRKTKSSGIAAFDAAVERGINESSPLPKKKNGTVENPILIGIKMNKVDK
jgi:colicin import membrane protein